MAAKNLLPWIRLVRPANLLIIVATQFLLRFCIIGAEYKYLGIDAGMPFSFFLLLVLSTVLIAAGGYIVNDLCDMEADQINKPEKVLAGEIIPVGAAWIVYSILTFTGVGIGFFLALKVRYLTLGFIFLAIAAMLWYYSFRYQKQVFWGNFVIAVLSAMTVLIVWLFEVFFLRQQPESYATVLPAFRRLNLFFWCYSGFAMIASLAREFIKDAEDREGDEATGNRNMAVVFGLTFSKWLAAVTAAIMMALLAAVQVWAFRNRGYPMAVYLTLILQPLILFILFRILRAQEKRDFGKISLLLKLFMLAGMLSMILNLIPR